MPPRPRVNKEASRRRRAAMSCTQLCRVVRSWPPIPGPGHATGRRVWPSNECLPRRALRARLRNVDAQRAAIDLEAVKVVHGRVGIVGAVVEVSDVHAAAVLVLATAEVSARLLLAALRPRLRREELHPHCPPIHVVAVKRVHSGLRASLLLEHHETETALAHRVEAVRHMLGADDGAELAEDVGEVLVLRREVEVANEELALL